MVNNFVSIEQYFYEELIPLAIEVGMPLDIFWDDDPELLYCYVKAKKEQITRDEETADIHAWVNGRYVLDALMVVNDAKGKYKYPKKPYSYKDPTSPKKVVDKETEMNNFHTKFLLWASGVNRKHRGG